MDINNQFQLTFALALSTLGGGLLLALYLRVRARRAWLRKERERARLERENPSWSS